MKKLRALVFAVGLAIPVLAGAAVDHYADTDRSVMRADASSGMCFVCIAGYCFWMPC